MTLGVLPLRERADDVTELILFEFPNVVADGAPRAPGPAASGAELEPDPNYAVPWTMPRRRPPPAPAPALRGAQPACPGSGGGTTCCCSPPTVRCATGLTRHALPRRGGRCGHQRRRGQEFCQDGLPHAFMFDANGLARAGRLDRRAVAPGTRHGRGRAAGGRCAHAPLDGHADGLAASAATTSATRCRGS